MRSKFLTTIFLFLLSISNLNAQTNADKGSFNIYFIGDAGKESTSGNTLDVLKAHLDSEGPNSAVVFLGDNIYPVGMPNINDIGRKNAEDAIKSQMDILKDYKGKIIFIPGNHDWKQGKLNGSDYLNMQEAFVETYLNRGNVFLPDDGCPGPVEVPLSEKAVLLIIDSEWWLYENEKPGKMECDITDDADFILQIKYALLRNKDKQIIVAAHHPLYSEGAHGSRFPKIIHLFPLTELNSKLWIPLPVLGTVYTLLRKNIQDIRHVRYQQLIEALSKAFKPYKNLIYVSGHEHNLQFFHKDDHYFVISGAGSKTSYVRKKGEALFAASKNGFVQLKLKNGEGANLSFIETKGADSLGKIAYQQKLDPASYHKPPAAIPDSQKINDRITVIASADYGAGNFKKSVLGKHYRQEWATPVEVDVLDITKAENGLTPTKRGGGNQTKSLRFQNKEGQEFVLRQIDKSPDKALPPDLRGSFASDFVKDPISSANPYAPLAVAPLAKAAGVYHSNPKLVYIPSSTQLGDFDEEFGNTYCLFENRLVDNQSKNPDVGYSEKLVTSEKMFKKYFSDNDHRIDQPSFLTARLFDMLIGDWDRHEDQWTWATFKEGKTTWYKPVPRDRDQAFSKLDGIIPWLGTRKWALRRTQNFGKKIDDVNGLMWAGRGLDRLFTTELTKEEWVSCAETLKKNLTDEVIDSAVRKMPAAIFLLSGKEIIEKLKARRNQLDKYAKQYYKFVNKEVEITGTSDREYFEVTRLAGNKTNVKVYNINKEGQKGHLFYNRTFVGGETHEVRLFGMGNDDIFTVSGKVNKGIRVRIVGGAGKDVITDSSLVGGISKKTKVYDQPGTILTASKETRIALSRDTLINRYSTPKSFQYNWSAPLPAYGYNPDDGIFIGYGRVIRRYKWRKMPYASLQTITANYAFKTSSFNIAYKGTFKQLIGKWDLNLEANIKAPNNASFYYGMGNETVLPNKERAFNRIRSDQYIFSPSISRELNRYHGFTVGIGYRSVKVEATEKRFVTDPSSGINPELFSTHIYGKVFAGYHLNTSNNRLYPTQGLKINTEYAYVKALNRSYKEKFSKFTGEAVFYIPVKTSLVIAHRTGFERNFGTFDFYDAASLGMKTNLRGYRAMRFNGREALYQNTELRLRLADLTGYIFRGKLGIYGFFDDGRVWVPEENSHKFHIGYGAGIYFSPFNMLALTLEYSISKESKIPGIRLGFFF